jgi:hypothetical protein
MSWLFTLLIICLHHLAQVETDISVRVIIISLTALISVFYLAFSLYSPLNGKPKPFLLLTLSACCSLSLLLATVQHGDWKTQTILFTHKDSTAQIAYQMKDIGGRGYLRRTIKVTRYLYLFNVIESADTTSLNTDWTKANIHVNKLGLKGG